MNIIGTMRAVDETRGAVRVEEVYDTDIDDLWEACTTPERLARWIAEVSGDLRVGGTIHAVFTSTWTGPGRVEVCDAPHHLLLTMEPGTDDESQMEAWLTEEGSKTRLVVEERGPVEGFNIERFRNERLTIAVIRPKPGTLSPDGGPSPAVARGRRSAAQPTLVQ